METQWRTLIEYQEAYDRDGLLHNMELLSLAKMSPGKIISVKSPKFEALSRNGYAEVTIVNTGELVAAFTLGVCNVS